MKWSDGQALTGNDVKFTFETGKLAGSELSTMWKTGLTNIVVKGNTVSFVFKGKPNYLDWNTNIYSWGIVPQHLWKNYTPTEITTGNTDKYMVGTGPFAYGAGKGTSGTLQWNRRSNWWATKALGMKMPMQYLVDIHNTQNTASLQNFLKNDIDLSNNFFPGVDKSIGGKVQTYYTKAPYMLSANTAWLVPNTTHAPLNDAAFRRALAMSINIDQIVKADYGNIVAKADPTGLLPTWNKWIDKAQSNKLGFKYNIAGAKSLLAANGYKDTNGDGYVENKQGQSVNLRLIVPDGWSDWMTAIQIIAASAKEAGIKITPAYPDYNGLVDERNSGKFDLVINNDKQLGPTPYTYYDYLFHLPVAATQTFANYSRFTSSGPKPWALTLALNKVEPVERGGSQGDSLEDPEVHPRGSPCDPALVQRPLVAGQYDVLDELPVRSLGAEVHAERLERLHQHDGHRRARQPEAREVSHFVARRQRNGRCSPAGDTARSSEWRETTTGTTELRVTRYLARKTLLYLLTFFVAVTIDWAIPRLMPGNPIDGLISRIQADSTASQELHGYFTESFGLDQPLWRQYIDFWRGLLHGDLGPSIAYVGSTVSELIWAAVPYTLALLVPAIVLSYIAGNRVGAMAARRKVLDNTALPSRLHPHRDAVHVAGDRPRLFPLVQARHLPRLGRVRLFAAAGVDTRVRP